jgi:galactokinase
MRSWAAYVAGALVVLMRERGARFADGISMLVASAVPEGKGVSSSAALEVAVMSALAAAHGIALDGRELALLCQKARPAHAFLNRHMDRYHKLRSSCSVGLLAQHARACSSLPREL